MTSLEESDEEYLDDPIQLDIRKTTVTVNNSTTQSSQPIFEVVDAEGDLYIEKNNVFEKTLQPKTNTIPYKKVSITLPVSFFEIPRNVQLLNSCKQLSIKVVNCEKHPFYHKQFLSGNSSENDEEVDFYIKKGHKTNYKSQNDTMIEGSKKIRIRPVSSPYENLKVDSLKNTPKRKDTHLKQNLNVTAVSNPQIDFKKNQGLIGMKITQTPDVSLKVLTEKKNITKLDKPVDSITEATKKDKLIVQETKEKSCKNNKIVKKKEVTCTPTTKNATKISEDICKAKQNNSTVLEKLLKTPTTKSATKITDDICKAKQNNSTGIEKIKDITNSKVESKDNIILDDNAVHSFKNFNIGTETNIKKLENTIACIEPNIQKNKLIISEKNKKGKIKDVQDITKKVQSNTKAHLSNKLTTNKVVNTQEVKEKVHQNKSTACNKVKVPEIRERINQDNVQLVGMNTDSTLNSQKHKMDSNNTNVSAKWNFVNNEPLKIFDGSKTMIKSDSKSNSASGQSVILPGTQIEQHLCSVNDKEKYNLETTYSAKLQGLKLTVTKKDSENTFINNPKTAKAQKNKKAVNRVKTKKEDHKKISSDSVKSSRNDSSNFTGAQNGIFKPVKNKSKKSDTKLMNQKNDSKIQACNPISNNSDINLAHSRFGNNANLLTTKIMKNCASDFINNKSKSLQNLHENKYYSSNSAVDKPILEGTTAPVFGNGQSSSFYVNEYEKIMQSSSQQNSDNKHDGLQYLNQQVNTANCKQSVKVPCVDNIVKGNTRPVNQNSSIENLLTSSNLIKENLSGNSATAINHCNNSNVSVTVSNNIKPNVSVTLNPSAPISIQNPNQNLPCFTTNQSNMIAGNFISKYTHMVQNQPNQIPLNIPTGKRCPRIIKINKRNPAVAYVNTIENNNCTAGIIKVDPTTQKNFDNQNGINNYWIQDRPIQTLVTTRDNIIPKQKPSDLQRSQESQNMLSNLYSAAQQITRNPFIPKQNVQQLHTGHQAKPPIVSPNNLTGCHFQPADPQYKTCNEILPPTCDIAMVRMTPGYDTKKLYHQSMPNTMSQPQQQRNIPPHIFLRNEPYPGKNEMHITQPNMKTSCQNLRNLKFLIQKKTKAAMPKNISILTPTQESNQKSVPFGYAHHQNVSSHGHGFQQAFKDFNGIAPQNFVHCAPLYDSLPSNMNPPNQMQGMQNYWGALYNPSILPPPPPPLHVPPPPLHVLGQRNNQMPGPYHQYNNSLAPKSVAGTTIIGHDDSGPVRKININVEPISKELNESNKQLFDQSNLQDKNIDKKNMAQSTDSKKEISGNSPVAYSKKEMLEELTKITTIESSSLSPVKDLKRPLPDTNTVQLKRYKPGPLSKKLKFDSAISARIDTSVAPVTHKGYSPPILPIPTYQKTLEILARSNITEPRLSHSISTDDREMKSLNATVNMNNQMEIVQKVSNCSDENQDKAAKKISLDEYKKRACNIGEKEPNNSDMHTSNIKMEIKIENPEQDLGYDSDSTTKL